jgi:3-hydroxyisobutyrate dehydrogenase
MGYPMARHIAKAGHDVTVYNRTTAKAENGLKNLVENLQKLQKKQAKTLILYFAALVMITI